jgi:hypothetical protein
LNLSGIEQIAFNSQDYAAARREIGLCTREFIRITRNERNVAALRTNMSRKHEPKSARPACDKRDLVAQGVARRSNDAADRPEEKKSDERDEQSITIHPQPTVQHLPRRGKLLRSAGAWRTRNNGFPAVE